MKATTDEERRKGLERLDLEAGIVTAICSTKDEAEALADGIEDYATTLMISADGGDNAEELHKTYRLARLWSAAARGIVARLTEIGGLYDRQMEING